MTCDGAERGAALEVVAARRRPGERVGAPGRPRRRALARRSCATCTSSGSRSPRPSASAIAASAAAAIDQEQRPGDGASEDRPCLGPARVHRARHVRFGPCRCEDRGALSRRRRRAPATTRASTSRRPRPGGGQGVWIRHTVHKRPGERAHRLALVHALRRRRAGPAGDQADRRRRAGLGARRRLHPGRRGDARARRARAARSPRARSRRAGTSTFDARPTRPSTTCPTTFLYGAPLPKTKFLCPYPDARFNGTVDRRRRADRARRLAGDGRPQLGRRARRALGLDPGDEFRRGPTATSTSALGRIKVGPLTTPWVGNAMLVLDGEQHRLGGLDRIRSTRGRRASRPSASSSSPARTIKVRGRVALGAAQLRRLGLRRPGRPRAQHAQLLDLRPRADGRAQGREPPRASSASGAAAYELGMRETDHGIPLQPYPDG